MASLWLSIPLSFLINYCMTVDHHVCIIIRSLNKMTWDVLPADGSNGPFQKSAPPRCHQFHQPQLTRSNFTPINFKSTAAMISFVDAHYSGGGHSIHRCYKMITWYNWTHRFATLVFSIERLFSGCLFWGACCLGGRLIFNIVNKLVAVMLLIRERERAMGGEQIYLKMDKTRTHERAAETII